jgi:Tol biopolymer transport system component
MRTAIAAGTVAVLAFAAFSPAAHASHDDGVIVWTHRAAEGSEHLLIARADGSRQRVLTTPQPDTVDLDAAISPNGRWVLYGRETPTGFHTRIIGVDGRHDRAIDLRCSDPCAGTTTATWLSNEWIAYNKVVGPFDQPNESARSAVLWTARTDGSGIRRLSKPGIDGLYEDKFARPSPDGRYVTFLRGRNDTLDTALFRRDRHGEHQLTPWSLWADHFDLSPARRGPTRDLVVFQTYGKGDPSGTGLDLATVPATCPTLTACAAKIRYVTHNGSSGRRNANPAWSLDGKRIVFTDRASEQTVNAEIWTMRHDGTRWRRVTSSPEFDYRPDWGRASWLSR